MPAPLQACYRGESGTYISLVPTVESVQWLSRFLGGSIPGRYTQPAEFHTTLIWSKTALSPKQQLELLALSGGASATFDAVASHLTAWEGHDGDVYLVLKLESPDLVKLNSVLVNRFGLAGDFDTYQPHVTLVTKIRGVQPPFQDVPVPKQKLIFTGLRIEDAK